MGRRHATFLWILLLAFCFRVLAQLIVAFFPLPFLPPFGEWHSATLPYPLLVSAQFAIIALYIWMALRIGTATSPRPKLGRFLISFGGLYFAFMLARFVLGLTWLRDVPWFHAPIPSLFHLVLAGFLLVAGHYHLRTVAPDARTGAEDVRR